MRNTKFASNTKSGSSIALGIAIFPLVFGVIVISVIPTIVALGSSFTNIVLGLNVKWKFVGFHNFIAAFHNSLFVESFKIGFIWSFSVTLIALIVGLICVVLINQREWYSPLLKFSAMIPWAMSPVAIAIIWQFLLDPSSGPINWFLKLLHLPGRNLSLLGDFNTAFPVVIVIGAWVSVPVIVISLLASFKNLRSDLIEAAQIDGANAFQVFRNVTIPHLKPVIFALFVLNVIWNFNSFGLVYVLTSGGPGGKTYLPALFVYHESFKYGNLGYASALGTIITVTLLMIFCIYLGVRKLRERN